MSLSLTPLAELYEHVRFFALDFAATTLKRATGPRRRRDSGPDHPTQHRNGGLARPLSGSEIRRLELTFLRFEIYCNLFRNLKWMGPRRSVSEEWFWEFSYWENEQLACVHD
jgi:hypothetical protein